MAKRLDDEIEAEELFQRADSFHQSALLLGGFPVQVSAIYFQGGILCGSCAVELYMKILAQIERREPPLWGHDISSLIQDLSPKTQRRLKQSWIAENGEFIALAKSFKKGRKDWQSLPTNYESALALSAEAFVEWRYGRKTTIKGWFIGSHAAELRKIILELKPEWAPSAAARVRFDPHAQLRAAKDKQPIKPRG